MAKASKNAILLADRRMTGEAEKVRSKFDLHMDAITTANIRPARVKFLSPKPIRCCAYQSGMACPAGEELVVLDVSECSLLTTRHFSSVSFSAVTAYLGQAETTPARQPICPTRVETTGLSAV